MKLTVTNSTCRSCQSRGWRAYGPRKRWRSDASFNRGAAVVAARSGRAAAVSSLVSPLAKARAIGSGASGGAAEPGAAMDVSGAIQDGGRVMLRPDTARLAADGLLDVIWRAMFVRRPGPSPSPPVTRARAPPGRGA